MCYTSGADPNLDIVNLFAYPGSNPHSMYDWYSRDGPAIGYGMDREGGWRGDSV